LHRLPPFFLLRRECLPSSAFRRRARSALLMPYDNAASFTSGPPSVAVNTEDSAETLPETAWALAVMPSTRSNCVFTWVIVSLAPCRIGSVFSCALRIAAVASSSVRPSLTNAIARNITRNTKAPAAISAAICPADTCPPRRIVVATRIGRQATARRQPLPTASPDRAAELGNALEQGTFRAVPAGPVVILADQLVGRILL